MPSTKNVDALAQIKEDLADVQAVWVVDYRGLTVKEAQELRRNIREAVQEHAHAYRTQGPGYGRHGRDSFRPFSIRLC